LTLKIEQAASTLGQTAATIPDVVKKPSKKKQYVARL
jgi:hypothetical protein